MEGKYLEDERDETFKATNAEKVGLPKEVKEMRSILFEGAKRRLPDVVKKIEYIRRMTSRIPRLWGPRSSEIGHDGGGRSDRQKGPEIHGWVDGRGSDTAPPA